MLSFNGVATYCWKQSTCARGDSGPLLNAYFKMSQSENEIKCFRQQMDCSLAKNIIREKKKKKKKRNYLHQTTLKPRELHRTQQRCETMCSIQIHSLSFSPHIGNVRSNPLSLIAMFFLPPSFCQRLMTFKAASHNQQHVYNPQLVIKYFRIHRKKIIQIFHNLFLYLLQILGSEFLLAGF